MRSCPAVTAVFSILLFTTMLGAGVIGLQAGATDDDPEQEFGAAEPAQVIELNITDDGDVDWTISHRFHLDDGEEAAFIEYAEAVQRGERQVGYDPGTFSAFLQYAEETTDREMAIVEDGWDDPDVVTEDNETVGVLSYSFTWESFATADGNHVYFGDAFSTAEGPWLSLHEGQELVVRPPESFAFEDAPPTETRDGALVWTGPHSFSDGELDIVLVRTGQVLGMNPIVAAGLGVAVVVVTLGSYLAARRYGGLSIPEPTVPGFLRRRSTATGTPTETEEADPTVVAYEEEETIDEELLSDEERVLRMLVVNGGRMKQANIVKETGWSNAKVSQLLSEMDDQGEIEKLRIGRENLITLPEVDPTAIE